MNFSKIDLDETHIRLTTDLERHGLIYELDMEMLRQACILYDDLRRRGTPISCVSINLSRLDFAQDDLFEKICSVLEAHGVPHEAIHLEITESLMLEDAETFEKTFRQFKDAGFVYFFIDEITLIEDFIDNASLLSDVYAPQGLKFVLSGTDSL